MDALLTKKSGKKKKKAFTLDTTPDEEPPAAAAAPTADAPASAGAGESATAAAPGATAATPPEPGTKAVMTDFHAGEELKRTCRFYRKDFPDVDEMVMVFVKSFKRDDPGATAELLEYDGLEGMILTSELSKRRIRSVYKLLTVGTTEPVKVLRVDREKGYIDLSKRQADSDEKKACQEKFYRSKTVNIILYKACRKLGCNLDTLYETVAWPLADKYGHALNGFNEAVRDNKVLLDLPGVDKPTVDLLLSLIRRKLSAKAVTLSVDIELACFEEIGVDAVVQALKKAEEVSTPDLAVSARVIAAPSYRLVLTTANTALGATKLQEAVNTAEAEIKRHGGKFNAHEIVIPEQDTMLSDSESDSD